VNFAAIEKIANAVLYEGYILYPYRASSTKNRQRWNFGTMYPQTYAEAQRPAEAFRFVTECLVKAASDARLDIRIRFLQLVDPADKADGQNSAGDWQHGIERSHDFNDLSLANVSSHDLTLDFSIPAKSVDVAAKELIGRLNISVAALSNGYKLHLELTNLSPSDEISDRNRALLQSFTSAHLLIAIEKGEFISLLDPPDEFRSAANACKNQGVFPVLVGEQHQHSMMLCSPIILYDYPQIAPESGGDFFDSTEMDEMLALRVLTLTDEEKREMLHDDRARQILERTESLPQEHLMKVHGAIRGMRRLETDVDEERP
jgi:hypothetical protein